MDDAILLEGDDNAETDENAMRGIITMEGIFMLIVSLIVLAAVLVVVLLLIDRAK